jgi:hypothetical protein
MKTITWYSIRHHLGTIIQHSGLVWSPTSGLPADEHTGICAANYIADLMDTSSYPVALREANQQMVFVPDCLFRKNTPKRFRRLRGRVTNPKTLCMAPNNCSSIRNYRVRRFNDSVPDPLRKPFTERVYELLSSIPLAPGKQFSSLWSRNTSCDLYNYQHAVGLEFESYGLIERKQLIKALPIWTRVASDGSIRPPGDAQGHEIRVLLDRAVAEPRLFNLCKRFATLGLRVNKSCGLHIHLDARSLSYSEVVARAKVMDKWLHALMELLPSSRRDNTYCKWGVSPHDRYRAVNVLSWTAHKTIEVRCGSATLDYTKVLSWLRLVELIRAVSRGPKAGSCIATLEQLPLPAHDLAFWRARHRELNPAQYTTAATDTTTDSE